MLHKKNFLRGRCLKKTCGNVLTSLERIVPQRAGVVKRAGHFLKSFCRTVEGQAGGPAGGGPTPVDRLSCKKRRQGMPAAAGWGEKPFFYDIIIPQIPRNFKTCSCRGEDV